MYISRYVLETCESLEIFGDVLEHMFLKKLRLNYDGIINNILKLLFTPFTTTILGFFGEILTLMEFRVNLMVSLEELNGILNVPHYQMV